MPFVAIQLALRTVAIAYSHYLPVITEPIFLHLPLVVLDEG